MFKRTTTLYGSLSLRHGASSVCRWRWQSPNMEGSCEYIQLTAMGRQHGVIF